MARYSNNVGWLRTFIFEEIQKTLAAGSNITLTLGDKTITIASSGGGGGGSGDVTGPGSSTDNAVVRFDGTGGKTLQNSGVTIDDSNNLTVAGDLTVEGSDVIIKNGGNTVTLSVDSNGRWTVTPSAAAATVRFNATIETTAGDSIVATNDLQAVLARDFF